MSAFANHRGAVGAPSHQSRKEHMPFARAKSGMASERPSLCVSTLHVLLNNWKPMGSSMSFEIEIIGSTHLPSPLHSVSGSVS